MYSVKLELGLVFNHKCLCLRIKRPPKSHYYSESNSLQELGHVVLYNVLNRAKTACVLPQDVRQSDLERKTISQMENQALVLQCQIV